jgi:hypothetical protein
MHEPMIGGGMLTNWLAIAGLISLMYWAWRMFAAFQHRAGGTQAVPRMPEAVATAAALVARSVAHPPLEGPGPGAPLEDIAAIAAAVTAMLGAHRIIHLEAVGPGHWAFEGRWAQQTSHNPG